MFRSSTPPQVGKKQKTKKDISSYFVVPQSRQPSQASQIDFGALGVSRQFNFSSQNNISSCGSSQQARGFPSTLSQSQSELSQDEIGFSLCTPQDQPAIAKNVLRSPSPMPKKKSRHSVLSPHGLDDLRVATEATRNCGSGAIFSFGSGPHGSMGNSNDGFEGIRCTPGDSQDELDEIDDTRCHRDHPRKTFRQNHLNSMNKENVLNQHGTNMRSNAQQPGRRARRRTLPSCAKNPFLKDPPGSRKRLRRPKMPVLDEYEEVEVSRYLEDFEESEQLGEGNFCITYKCRNRLDGAVYAIKRARRRMHGEADKKRMVKESFALAALADVPHIVPYHSSWIEDDRLYIQLGFCAGGNVQDAVLSAGLINEEGVRFSIASEGRLTAFGALVILKQIGSALAEMHARDMVHLDVKPDNILIPTKNCADFCLGDLGMVAKRFTSKTDAIQEGDSRYCAKELILDDCNMPKDLAPADVWALGVSVYQLLRGLPEPPRDEYHAIRDGRLCLSSDLPMGLTQLLSDMVREDPVSRPSASLIAARAKEALSRLKAEYGSSLASESVSSSQGSVMNGVSGTMSGRGGAMLKAAEITNMTIEQLREELAKERSARQKAETIVLSLTSA
jgi:serine/threonine protein kinase